jgi:hypothetical protein
MGYWTIPKTTNRELGRKHGLHVRWIAGQEHDTSIDSLEQFDQMAVCAQHAFDMIFFQEATHFLTESLPKLYAPSS